MRLAIIPSWFPSSEHPLFGIFVLDQARALAATFADLEVHIIAPSGSAKWMSVRHPFASLALFQRSLNANASNIRETGQENLIVHRVQSLQMRSMMGIDGWSPYGVVVNRRLARIEHDYGPVDLVHAHVCHPAGVIAHRLRPSRRWILTEHQSPFPFPELLARDGQLDSRLVSAFRAAAAVVAVGRSHAADIAAYTGVSPVVIPNVCDETQFFPRTSREPGPFKFLFVGGLNEQKGVDLLLEAIAEFASHGRVAQFVIVGEGPLRERLRRRCEALGLGHLVEWRGAVSRKELPMLFRSADAFVLPSRHESFGVVCIEALATGLPVLATRCGGPEDIVDDTNGVLVPIENSHALAEGLERVMLQEWDSTAIRTDFLHRYSTRAVSTAIRQLYDSVLSVV